MKKSKNEAIEEINDCIKQNAGKYEEWYVGITTDPSRRLGEHCVNDLDTEIPSHRVAVEDEKTAREVENHFHELGCAGSGGGGAGEIWSVYCYRMTKNTSP
jgi:hypothetical protein